jgi:hypothetical protein
MVYTLFNEIREYVNQSIIKTLTSFWNWVDITLIGLWTASQILDQNRDLNAITEVVYSLVVLLSLLKFFFYVRIF